MVEFIPDDIDFSAYLAETDAQAKVKKAADFVDAAKAKLRARASTKRVYLPWPKCNESFEFRSGEVTVWAGQNGHGKTDVTTQIALSLVGQQEKICIASFEMKPTTTIARMVRMFAGTNPFSPEYQSDAGFDVLDQLYDQFGEWVGNRMYLYDQTGQAEPATVIGMVKYCAFELGITHIFIDSLMKCVRKEDDYNEQKEFVNLLCAAAKDFNCHIHLVHHLKKPEKESEMPDKHSTKGSGSITDQVDNLFMVWRNKPKEDDARSGANKRQAEPDSYLLCRKQRNYELSGDGEPIISLWRHRDAGQFVAEPGSEAQYFQNYPHVPF